MEIFGLSIWWILCGLIAGMIISLVLKTPRGTRSNRGTIRHVDHTARQDEEAVKLSPTGLDAETEAEIRTLVRHDRKIEAIKRYREATGMGLKESKDAIDAYEAEWRG